MRLRTSPDPVPLQESLAAVQSQLDSLMQCDLPLEKAACDQLDHCPEESCDGILSVPSLASLRDCRKAGNGPDPKLLQCSKCTNYFGSVDIIKRFLVKAHASQNLGVSPLEQPAVMEKLRWTPLHRPKAVIPNEPSLSEDITVEAYSLSMSALTMEYQLHLPQHVRPCFKKSKTCRYLCPHCPQEASSVTLQDQHEAKATSGEKHSQNNITILLVCQKRRPACIYISSYCKALLEIFRCNTYLSFVNDHRLSFYLAAYSSKHNREESVALAGAMSALLKYHVRTSASETHATRSDFSKGLGRLCSALRGHTGDEIVAGQMGAHLLLGNDIFNFSHEFTSLPLKQTLAMLNGEEVSGTILPTGVMSNTSMDYFYRPDHYTSFSCWDYLAQTTLVKIPQKKKRKEQKESDAEDSETEDPADESSPQTTGRVAAVRYPLQPQHPKASTFQVKTRTHAAVVRLSGKRLANLNAILCPEESILTKDILEQREHYAYSALIMFKPFRRISDLKASSETWWDAFQAARRSGSLAPSAEKILNHMQGFYVAFAENKDHLDSGEHDAADGPAGPNGNTDGDLDESVIVHADNTPCDTTLLQHKILRHLPPVSFEARTNLPHVSPETAEAVLKMMDTEEGQIPFSALTLTPATSSTLTSPTTVTLIMGAVADRSYVPAETNVRDPPTMPVDHPSISQQSAHYTLNHKQHLAFTLIAAAFLEKLALRIDPCSQRDAQAHEAAVEIIRAVYSKQWNFDSRSSHLPQDDALYTECQETKSLRMFLAGEGGCGKSRVITCAKDFCRRWGAPEAIVVTATTGCAAALVDGGTYFSGLGLPRSGLGRKPTQDRQTAWQPVAILIIDECSFLSPLRLWLINERLKLLRPGFKDNLFGNVHLVLCGDFFQLKSREKSLFENPIQNLASSEAVPDTNGHSDEEGQDQPEEDSTTTQYKAPPKDIADLQGHLLWRVAINAGIELVDNFRARDDPVFAQALARFRTNQHTLADITFFNQFVVSQSRLPPPGAFLATETNQERRAANFAAFYSYLVNHPLSAVCDHEPSLAIPATQPPVSWKERGALRILAHVTEAVRGDPLDPERVAYVRASTEEKLGKRAGALDIILNETIMIGANIDVPRKLANGCKAIVLDVLLHPGVVPVLTSLPGIHPVQVHTVECHQVACLVLLVHNPEQQKVNYYPNLRQALDQTKMAVPNGVVFMVPGNETTRKFAWKNGVTFTASITQFQAASCYAASTGHKVQGMTLQNILVGPRSRSVYNHDGWLYVCLSRCQKQEGLYLLTPLSDNMAKYKPRQNIINEMARLRRELFLPTEALLTGSLPATGATGGDRDQHGSRKRSFSFSTSGKPANDLGFSASGGDREQESSRKKHRSFSASEKPSTSHGSDSEDAAISLQQSGKVPTAATPSGHLAFSTRGVSGPAFRARRRGDTEQQSSRKRYLSFSASGEASGNTLPSNGSDSEDAAISLPRSVYIAPAKTHLQFSARGFSAKLRAKSSEVSSTCPSGLYNSRNHCFLLTALQMLFSTTTIKEVFLHAKSKTFLSYCDFVPRPGYSKDALRGLSKILFALFRNMASPRLQATYLDKNLLCRLLLRLGYQVHVQEDAAEVLHKLQTVLECIRFKNAFVFKSDRWSVFEVAVNDTALAEPYTSIDILASDVSSTQDALTFACSHSWLSEGKRKEEKMISAPQVLKIALKRLTQENTKLLSPIKLDPLIYVEICGVTCVYAAVSAAYHHGPTPEVGHWTCCTRREEVWYLLDDAEKSSTSWYEVVSKPSELTICFYERTDQALAIWQFLPDHVTAPLLLPTTPQHNWFQTHKFCKDGVSADDFTFASIRNRLMSTGTDGWLNDQIVNASAWVLNSLMVPPPNVVRSSYMLHSFFYTALVNQKQDMSRWFRNFDISLSTAELLLIPCNTFNHWILLCVSLREHKIYVLDSLVGFVSSAAATAFVNFWQQFYQHELERQLLPADPATWILQPVNCPQQQNFWDCGVYMLLFANIVARHGLGSSLLSSAPTSALSQNMPLFRIRLFQTLVRVKYTCEE